MKNIIAIIPARSGSRGIHKKNIKDFIGEPLICWTIKAALNSSLINKVIVDTDCHEIAAIARKHGAEVPYLRPSSLASTETAMGDVLINYLNYFETNVGEQIDALVLLLPTNPMRNKNHIDSCINQFFDNNAELIQKYQTEVTTYQAEVAAEVQEYTQNLQGDGMGYQWLQDQYTRLKAEYDQAFMIAAPKQQEGAKA